MLRAFHEVCSSSPACSLTTQAGHFALLPQGVEGNRGGTGILTTDKRRLRAFPDNTLKMVKQIHHRLSQLVTQNLSGTQKCCTVTIDQETEEALGKVLKEAAKKGMDDR